MAKLPQLTGAEVVRRLKRLGMEEDHCKGSHLVMRNPATGRMAAVPQHGSRTVKKGTLGAILKQLDISADDFAQA
jgi:predicted RNA binding protein YcfA (HicA-like mRNA interferase family)